MVFLIPSITPPPLSFSLPFGAAAAAAAASAAAAETLLRA